MSVCLSPKCKKTRFSQKLSNLELWCLLTTYRKLCKLNWAFQGTHYWIPTIQDGWDTPSWKSSLRHFCCRGWSDLDKISQTGTEWHVDCGDVWKWKKDVEFQYGGRLGEFNGMSSQSHVSHCRVLCCHLVNSLSWFQSHIKGCSHLAKSMSWSCHIAGCKNSIRHIEYRFSPYFIVFVFNAVYTLWRAAAFVSFPIDLFA